MCDVAVAGIHSGYGNEVYAFGSVSSITGLLARSVPVTSVSNDHCFYPTLKFELSVFVICICDADGEKLGSGRKIVPMSNIFF